MILPVKFHTNYKNFNRGTLTEIHIADIHFGALDPEYQYKLLEEQFLNKIANIQFDVLVFEGDFFHHKYMSNSDVVMYAIKFMDKVVNLARLKYATVIIIDGTTHHDAGQLKLFYHYMTDPTVDIRIIETVKFEYIKGKRVLCIPELYGKDEEYYNEFLLYSGMYDAVYMHGTLKGAIYGKNEENLGSNREPIFSINNFCNCLGPITSGHVHTPGCHCGHFYYCGCPYRWQFGQEEDKGFLILLHNLDTREYYVHFESIQSYRYDTFNLDHLIDSDPKHVIEYIKNLESQGIDNIRIEFTIDNEENLNIIRNYYKNSSNIKIEAESSRQKQVLKASEEIVNKYKDYDYIFDKNLSGEEIMSRYINHNKGFTYITSQELIDILNEI